MYITIDDVNVNVYDFDDIYDVYIRMQELNYLLIIINVEIR